MRLIDIQNAISLLAPNDLAQFSAWFAEYQEQVWDEQIARDVRAGRFDEPVKRAQAQFEAGQC